MNPHYTLKLAAEEFGKRNDLVCDASHMFNVDVINTTVDKDGAVMVENTRPDCKFQVQTGFSVAGGHYDMYGWNPIHTATRTEWRYQVDGQVFSSEDDAIAYLVHVFSSAQEGKEYLDSLPSATKH